MDILEREGLVARAAELKTSSIKPCSPSRSFR